MRRLATVVLALLGACAAPVEDGPNYAARADAALKQAFEGADPRITGRVLAQDEPQRLCTQYRDAPPPEVAQSIVEMSRAAIRYPESAALVGDWQRGKAIATDPGGMRFGDLAIKPNGGNCYACHQIEASESVYGTVGPSLRAYGVLRGSGEAMQRLTYARIYDAQAFTACATMPRFGHNGILTPEQIVNVVAYLLDPASPVNR